MTTHHEIVVAGAGFSGLAIALQFKRDGRDFIVLERANELGGTWRDNSYPGCACDIPSVLYSLTEEQNPRWSTLFAPQDEIWAYMRTVAERRGLLPHLRCGHEVRAATWNEQRYLWEIETDQTSFTANVFISAVGALAEPSTPNLPGLETFSGHTFHSARWDHNHPLEERKVAVIGTGASAVQFVPIIQPKVSELYLFQRTPPWVLPRPEIRIPQKWQDRFEQRPLLLRTARQTVFHISELRHLAFTHPRLMSIAERFVQRYIARQVPDPALRKKLTPNYRMGCKRILGSNSWYPAITAPNSTVVTSGIREVVPEGIIDGEGTLHSVDTVVFGTGFHVTDPPIQQWVTGRHSRTLADHWQGSPQAYLGTAVAGFPNFYMLLGPNTGLGHNSVLLMIESQIAYIRQALKYQYSHKLASIEPRSEAQSRFVSEIDRAMEGSVWTAGGCQSWYLDSTGRNSTLWPQTVKKFERRLTQFVPSDNILTPTEQHLAKQETLRSNSEKYD